MNPMLAYTLARIGLFVVVAALMLVLPFPISTLLKLMIAVLVSALLSFFLLRRLREGVALQLAARAEQRAAEKAKLRAALAGDEEPPAPVA
jgi:uncharacterized protein (DUF983 family)